MIPDAPSSVMLFEFNLLELLSRTIDECDREHLGVGIEHDFLNDIGEIPGLHPLIQIPSQLVKLLQLDVLLRREFSTVLFIDPDTHKLLDLVHRQADAYTRRMSSNRLSCGYPHMGCLPDGR